MEKESGIYYMVPVTVFVAVKKIDPKIPRPANPFILFRKDQQEKLKDTHQKVPNVEMSKIIGEMWRTQSQEVRKEYEEKAAEEKRRHSEAFPEVCFLFFSLFLLYALFNSSDRLFLSQYKYQPKKKKAKMQQDKEWEQKENTQA